MDALFTNQIQNMFIRLILLFTLILPLDVLAEENMNPDSNLEFAEIISGLTTKKFEEKDLLIKMIGQAKHDRSLIILKNLLDGKLYYKKDDKTIVIAEKSGKEAYLKNALDDADLGTVSKRKIKKIGINNKLRRSLNAEIAQLSLANNDPTVRKSAVEQMFNKIDEQALLLIKQRLSVEKNDDVIETLNTAISLENLHSSDKDVKLAAIAALSSSLYPEVRASLNKLKNGFDGENLSSDDSMLLQAIDKSLKKIESKVGLYKQVENIFFGISLGSVLLLIAVGLAITFGVMGVINMAHGEMLMLGAYTTYIIQQILPNHIEYSILISIPTAFIFTALVGIGIERGVIRFLYGRPLETLLATFGISLILQQAVRTLISPQNRAVSTPDWMSGSLEINPALSLTFNRLYIIIFAMLVLIGLMLLLNKSKFGLQVRAVTQNRSMAKAMGIRTDWIDAFTFGLGSGIAGIAGVALSQLTNVGPNLGQAYIIDSFMVVVFGGVGNLWGTLFGAMSLGIANKYLEPVTGAVLAKILVLIFIILFIQKKPRGMFALKGRSVES